MAPKKAKISEEAKNVEKDEAEDKEVDDDHEDESSSEEEEDEEDLDGSSDDDSDEEILVDFEFMDPKEIDFLGLKALLGNYLDGALFNSSELCDAIIAQNTVGTVLKAQGAGDEVDPIAVMSVMNLQRRKEMKWMQETIEYLKKNCPKDLKDQFEALLGEEGVGLIINERVINVPQETAQPLVNLLFDEISNATEDEPTEELRESFKFKKYILLTRTFLEEDAEPAGVGGGKRKRDAATEMVYPRPEDQFFHKVRKQVKEMFTGDFEIKL